VKVIHKKFLVVLCLEPGGGRYFDTGFLMAGPKIFLSPSNFLSSGNSNDLKPDQLKAIPALLLVAGGAFLLTKAAKAGVATRLNMFIGKIDIACSGFLCTAPIVTLNLIVQNPTETQLTIRSLSAKFFVNQQYVGDVFFFNNLPLVPMAETPFPVEARISAASVLSQVVAIIKGEQGIAAEMRMTGTCNVEGVNVPVDLQYKIV